MFTPRGVTVCVAGIAMWVVARLIGSGGLEVVGIGLALLPVVAGLFLRGTERRGTGGGRLSGGPGGACGAGVAALFLGWPERGVAGRRRLPEARVPPGPRLNIQLDVENRS